jgi:hypothetical protein
VARQWDVSYGDDGFHLLGFSDEYSPHPRRSPNAIVLRDALGVGEEGEGVALHRSSTVDADDLPELSVAGEIRAPRGGGLG